jgi:hypothetical protein
MAVTLALGLAACSSSPSPNSSTTVLPSARPSSTGVLTILSPQPGEVITGTSVDVKLQLTGATITKVVSTNLKPDEGHIHLKLDGVTITLLGSLEETVPNLTPGDHVIEAEFVASDHGPFNPRVVAQVTFTVAPS